MRIRTVIRGAMIRGASFLVRRLGDSERIGGFAVILPATPRQDEYRTLIAAAIAQLLSHDHVGSRYFRRYAKIIAVRPGQISTVAVSEGMIVISGSVVERNSVNILVLVLAHESAHLRMGALLTPNTAEQCIAMERRCMQVSRLLADQLTLSAYEQEWLGHHVDLARHSKSVLMATLENERTGVALPKALKRFLLWLREPVWRDWDVETTTPTEGSAAPRELNRPRAPGRDTVCDP